MFALLPGGVCLKWDSVLLVRAFAPVGGPAQVIVRVEGQDAPFVLAALPTLEEAVVVAQAAAAAVDAAAGDSGPCLVALTPAFHPKKEKIFGLYVRGEASAQGPQFSVFARIDGEAQDAVLRAFPQPEPAVAFVDSCVEAIDDTAVLVAAAPGFGFRAEEVKRIDIRSEAPRTPPGAPPIHAVTVKLGDRDDRITTTFERDRARAAAAVTALCESLNDGREGEERFLVLPGDTACRIDAVKALQVRRQRNASGDSFVVTLITDTDEAVALETRESADAAVAAVARAAALLNAAVASDEDED